MSPPPLTSVLLVGPFEGADITQTLDSVLAQTTPVEVLVVGNGSAPEALTVATTRATTDPRMRVLTDITSLGFAKAHNEAAREAKGQALLILTPGIVVPSPDALSQLLHFAAGIKKRPWGIGARLVDHEGREAPIARRAFLTPLTAVIELLRLFSLPGLPERWRAWLLARRFRPSHLPWREGLTPVQVLCSAFLFIPLKDFTLLHGFKEGYDTEGSLEDLDFALRLARAEGCLYATWEITVTWVPRRAMAPSGWRSRLHTTRSLSNYFHRHFSYTWPQPALWLLDAGLYVRWFGQNCRAWIAEVTAPLRQRLTWLLHATEFLLPRRRRR